MKINIKNYYLLLFVMIIFYSPITFAPWSHDHPPVRPIDGPILRTCTQWISYHGFTLDNPAENRAMAQTRAHMFDKFAFKWAAIYAYFIDEKEPTNTLLPETFCNTLGTPVSFTYQYLTLKDEAKSCCGWISLYRFSHHDLNYNVTYAENRSPGKNYAISIWADSYYSYLVAYGKTHAISPTEFCSKIGKYMEPYRTRGQDIRFMYFMSEYDSNLTCYGWIYQYEFNDDITFNYEKAMQLISEQVNNHISIQYWPREYSKFLKSAYHSDTIKKEDKTPRGYCHRILWNDDDFLKYSFHYDPDDPESFDD